MRIEPSSAVDALPERPAWGDGQDAEGRSVLLCGRSALGTGPEAEAVVVGVLEALRGGHLQGQGIAVDAEAAPGDSLYSADIEGQATGTVVNAASAPAGGCSVNVSISRSRHRNSSCK